MLSLRCTNYKPSSAMLAHHHEQPSLIVVLGGAYLERIQGSEIEHTPGHMLFYPAFTTHSQTFGKAGARKLVFTPSASSLDYLANHGISLEAERHTYSPAIVPLASRALTEMRNQDEFAPLALEGVLLELVATFARGTQDGVAAAPTWVRAARDRIRDTPDRNDSLEEIAAALGHHPVHLARQFRRYFGASIGEYRRRLRLEKAAEMLRHKNLELTEIALASASPATPTSAVSFAPYTE